jgi:hypothetical protein
VEKTGAGCGLGDVRDVISGLFLGDEVKLCSLNIMPWFYEDTV